MAKEVSINLFDMEWDDQRSQRLSDTLDEFVAQPLDRRWRDDIRLERCERYEDRRREVFLLDFCKRREVGPGRLGQRVPIEAIMLRGDEDFGEETAALYSPSKRWLLVLHNYAGVGPSRMSSYFNALDPGNAQRHFDYAARPRLDAAALARFGGMRSISKVTVTATLDALTAAHADTGTALAQATRAVNARRIKFELSANDAYQRGNTLSMAAAMRFIRGLQRQDVEEVSQLQVKGEVDGRDQMIDLLEHKVRRKYPVTELQVLHHRYTLESRWSLLLRTFHGWHDNL